MAHHQPLHSAIGDQRVNSLPITGRDLVLVDEIAMEHSSCPRPDRETQKKIMVALKMMVVDAHHNRPSPLHQSNAGVSR